MTEKPEIQDTTYLYANPESSVDSKQLIALIKIHEAYLRSIGYTPAKAKALFEKQREEIETSKDRVTQRLNEKKGKKEMLILAEIEEVVFRKMEIQIPDETHKDFWLPCKRKEKIRHVERDKFGEEKFSITVTPEQNLRVSFFKALLTLPNPITNPQEFSKALHDQYNGYVVHQNYPLDMTKTQHQFRIKLVWKV